MDYVVPSVFNDITIMDYRGALWVFSTIYQLWTMWLPVGVFNIQILLILKQGLSASEAPSVQKLHDPTTS